MCQRASVPAVSINTPARAHVYILENCWHAGTLAHFLLFIPSPRTPLCLPKTVPFGGGVDMPSTRGRPAKDPRKTHGKVREGEILIIVRLLRFTPRPAFQAPTGQHNPIMNRQGKKKAVEQVIPARQPFLIVPSPPPSSSTKRTCVSLPRYPNRNNGLLGGRNPATRLL